MLLHLLPLLLFLQLVHLLLVITVQRYLDWEDGVLVVAVPLHAVAVQVAGVFHSDELFLLQFCDVFHDSGHREMHRSSQIYKDMASLDRQYKTKSGENDKKQLQKKTLEGIILTENLQEETIMMKSELVLEREYEYYDV